MGFEKMVSLSDGADPRHAGANRAVTAEVSVVVFGTRLALFVSRRQLRNARHIQPVSTVPQQDRRHRATSGEGRGNWVLLTFEGIRYMLHLICAQGAVLKGREFSCWTVELHEGR